MVTSNDFSAEYFAEPINTISDTMRRIEDQELGKRAHSYGAVISELTRYLGASDRDSSAS